MRVRRVSEGSCHFVAELRKEKTRYGMQHSMHRCCGHKQVSGPRRACNRIVVAVTIPCLAWAIDGRNVATPRREEE